MANITMTHEELLHFMAGDDLPKVREIKRQMQDALIDGWLAEPEFRERLNAKADEMAEKVVTRHIDKAFTDTTQTWGNPKRTFAGWMTELAKGRLDNELKDIKSVGVGSLVRVAISDEMKEQQRAWEMTLEEAVPFVEKLVRKLVPQYTTAEYKERVANHFDEKQVDKMLSEMVQSAIGHMVMSGAFSFNAAKLPKDGV